MRVRGGVTTIGIVGAGVTGLTAARTLRRAGLDVVVFENERRPGGVIVSERVADGSLVEGGPDGFLAADPEIPQLAADLGIADDIVAQSARGSFVWDGRTVAPLDEGEAAGLLGIEVRAEDLKAGHASFADGMGELVAALADNARDALQLGRAAISIQPSETGVRLNAADGSTVELAAVVLALPAHRAALLIRGPCPGAGDAIKEIRYAPSLTVTLGYDAEQVRRPLEGTGFVVAERVGIALRACTYVSRKFPQRAPEGRVVLRAFLRPGTAPADAQAHALLAAILEIEGEPRWHRVYEWPRGLPIYENHHAEQVAAARSELAAAAPLFLAGAAFDGPGVSACVRSGRLVARQVEQHVSGRVL